MQKSQIKCIFYNALTNAKIMDKMYILIKQFRFYWYNKKLKLKKNLKNQYFLKFSFLTLLVLLCNIFFDIINQNKYKKISIINL